MGQKLGVAIGDNHGVESGYFNPFNDIPLVVHLAL
jgi:hypothetical protein